MERTGLRRCLAVIDYPWLIVGAVTLAATLFRFAIARYSLWFDEQAAIFFAQQPLEKLWGSWMVREPNPPLYYSLLKGWIFLFGDSERAARGLSIAAGAGSIVATALFTSRIYGRKAGVIAAALTALSAEQLYYSLQVRTYEVLYLVASCVLASLVDLNRSLRLGRGRTFSLICYALGCTIAIYLHTTMFLLPVICTTSILIVRRHELMAKPILLLPLMSANLAIAIAAGWWLDITVKQLFVGAENIAVFDPVTPWLVIQQTVGTLFFVKDHGAGFTPIAIIFTIIAIVQAKSSWQNPDTKIAVIIILVSIGILSVISIKVPIFLPRSIFWLSIITNALCAAGINQIDWQPARRWAIFGLGSLVALNMATSVGIRQTEDWNLAIRSAQSLPGSHLLVQSEAMGLLLKTACLRVNSGICPVPIIAITTQDDQLDGWASGLFTGQSIAMEKIDDLPKGQYFVFRKEFYHDLIVTLNIHGKARLMRDDLPLLGPIDRSALIQ